VLALLAIASTPAATLCFLSYQSDCKRLREVATAIVSEAHSPADRVIALLHWVYDNQPTTENQRYFLFPRHRATPYQVLETGGDCADKSRLLSAMLREIGIPASMAMCFDPPSGNPTHTVVVATIAPNTTIVVDPAYDLCFPKSQPGQYYGLLDLRADDTILPRRLDQLQVECPLSHPIHYYKREIAGYSQASCINWERNRLTRVVRNWLAQDDTQSIHVFPRPLITEEPKLFVSVCAHLTAALAAAAFSIVNCLMRRHSRRTGPHLFNAIETIPDSNAMGAYPCGR